MVAEARVLNLWDLSASSIYDTIPSVSYRVFKKKFNNPDDTLVGAFIASFQGEDSTRMVNFTMERCSRTSIGRTKRSWSTIFQIRS